MNRYEDLHAYAAFELVHSLRDLGQEGYAASLIGSKNVVYPPWIARAGVSAAVPSPRRVPVTLAVQGLLVGPRRAADTSIVEAGAAFYLPVYLPARGFNRHARAVPASPVTRRGSRFAPATCSRSRGPDPGFSGFEYPLAPRQIFLEIAHMY